MLKDLRRVGWWGKKKKKTKKRMGREVKKRKRMWR
jgi:hypothetical protein